MSTVHHPNIAGVTNTVPSGDVAKWKQQGWLSDEPKSPAVVLPDDVTPTVVPITTAPKAGKAKSANGNGVGSK